MFLRIRCRRTYEGPSGDKDLPEIVDFGVLEKFRRKGILLRICRSIQAEGAFGLLKNDYGFRRFLTRGKRNVRTELFLLGMGFNLKKL